MAQCKTCGRKFHACSNCSLSNSWEYHYCNTNCWKNSDEYKVNNILINSFVLSLTKPQLEAFKEIINLDDDYWAIIEGVIRNFTS